MSIAGNQRLVTSRGLITVEDAYEDYENLFLFDNKDPVLCTNIFRTTRPIYTYRVTCHNGMTLDVSETHPIAIRDYVRYRIVPVADLVVGKDRARMQQAKGLFGNPIMTMFDILPKDYISENIWLAPEYTQLKYVEYVEKEGLDSGLLPDLNLLRMNLSLFTQVSSKIISVELTGKRYGYSLDVQSKDNLLIANGFLIAG